MGYHRLLRVTTVSQDGGVKVSVELVIPMNLLPPPDEPPNPDPVPVGEVEDHRGTSKSRSGSESKKKEGPRSYPLPPV